MNLDEMGAHSILATGNVAGISPFYAERSSSVRLAVVVWGMVDWVYPWCVSLVPVSSSTTAALDAEVPGT